MLTSESLDKLAPALLGLQCEATNPLTDKANTHFNSKYVTLGALLDHMRPLLVKNDLILTQHIDDDHLVTLLLHKSGQFIQSSQRLIVDRQNMQGLGSAITYARRYGVSAVLGVASEEDDDGNAAVKGSGSAPFDAFEASAGSDVFDL